MTTKLEILEGNYWEHYKFAKDMALVYPIDHPKRVEIEKTLNDLQYRINSIKNSKQKTL
jgi:hypothetical protein